MDAAFGEEGGLRIKSDTGRGAGKKWVQEGGSLKGIIRSAVS